MKGSPVQLQILVRFLLEPRSDCLCPASGTLCFLAGQRNEPSPLAQQLLTVMEGINGPGQKSTPSPGPLA